MNRSIVTDLFGGAKDFLIVAAAVGTGIVAYRIYKTGKAIPDAVRTWWDQKRAELSTFGIEFDQEMWERLMAKPPGSQLSDLYAHIAEIGPLGPGQLFSYDAQQGGIATR